MKKIYSKHVAVAKALEVRLHHLKSRCGISSAHPSPSVVQKLSRFHTEKKSVIKRDTYCYKDFIEKKAAPMSADFLAMP